MAATGDSKSFNIFRRETETTTKTDREMSSGKPPFQERTVPEIKEFIAEEFDAEVAEKFEGK